MVGTRKDTALAPDKPPKCTDSPQSDANECRWRLLIMDSQIEALRQERAELQALILMLKDIARTYHPHTFQKQLNKLTARILADAVNELEGPKNEREKDECQRLAAGFYREIS